MSRMIPLSTSRRKMYLPKNLTWLTLSRLIYPLVMRLIFQRKEVNWIHSIDKIITHNIYWTGHELIPNLPPDALVGRRIVELSYMAQQMQCKNCGTLLHLRDFFGIERRYGLASEIPLRCSGCCIVQYVNTSRDSNSKNLERDRRARVYDTNTKLALGIFFCYFSEFQFLWK